MRPAPALVVALVAWGLLGLAVAFAWLRPEAWAVAGALVAVLAAVDAFRGWRLPTPLLHRELPPVLALGVRRDVVLTLSSTAALRLDVHDLHPGGWPVDGAPWRVDLHPGKRSHLHYGLTPVERGGFAFAGCDLRLHSPLRLWRQRRRVPLPAQVKVFPDFAPLARFALFNAEAASRAVGAHLRRRRGEGTEFQQLREYRVGDSLRQIDWKASQRSRRLISREYQEEHNQNVLLLIDTGRRMLAKDDALSHFDHVLNAALLVAYIALRQGDAVGLLASGGDERWVPPLRGIGGIDRMMHAVHDLQARPVATDYLAAATQLALRQQRRALVMLVTNARDEDGEDLLGAVRLLRARHRLVVASLREGALDTQLEQEPADLPAAIRSAAVADYLGHRQRAHEALRAQGVPVLDVTCAQLPGALVEHYLALRRSGVI
jgi:uncharacterized protein (DUF58 family)